MSLVVEKFTEPGDVKVHPESFEKRLRKNFLALPLEKKAIMRKFVDRYNRCPSCNHEFPHHWAGCSEVRDQRI